MNTQKATRRSISTFHQIVQFIPEGLIERLSVKHKTDARKFSATSHVLSLLLGHLTHAFSLNEICDIMALHEREVCRTRGVTAPKRNTFSHANRTRDPKLAEDLYWKLFSHLQSVSPTFGRDKLGGVLSKFRMRNIFAIDSTTIQLSIKCIDWAKHRRKKAAVKTHMRCDVANMLPRCAIVETAAHHDSTKAMDLCAGLGEGDILIADKAYVVFSFLHKLNERNIFFVLRQKENMQYKTLEESSCKGNVLSDEKIVSTGVKTHNEYPEPLRRIVADVEIEGKIRRMVFFTNNFTWAASTITELYKARWSVELLFKELKQTLQLQDFYGENENAVKWQIWAALIVHLLTRYLKHISGWKSSYSRLVGCIRTLVWMKVDLTETLRSYGTAPPVNTMTKAVEELLLPGF